MTKGVRYGDKDLAKNFSTNKNNRSKNFFGTVQAVSFFSGKFSKLQPQRSRDKN